MRGLPGYSEAPAHLSRMELRFGSEDLEHLVLGEREAESGKGSIESGLDEVVESHRRGDQFPRGRSILTHGEPISRFTVTAAR